MSETLFGRRRRGFDYKSATRLASLAICENQAMLKDRYGVKLTGTQERAVKRGELEHERHHKAVLRLSDRRCFIATAVFGEDASQTELLRLFRDRYMVQSVAGRIVVNVYYRISPLLIPVIERCAWLKKILSKALSALLKLEVFRG